MTVEKPTLMVLLLLIVTAVTLYSSYSWNVSLSFSLCSCSKCLGDSDPYFRDLITAGPQQYLSKRTISEDIFKWWKGLQGNHGNFSQYKSTLERLFDVFPSPKDVSLQNPGRCLTCAVVGNSGNLKESRYGALIDLHDVVMRMNRGRTEGFEDDVGRKTTHHIFYPESAKTLENRTELLFVPFKISDLTWLLNKFTSPPLDGATYHRLRIRGSVLIQKVRGLKSNMIANKDLVKILNPAFMKYVHEEWLEKSGRYPSTGFLTLALSMKICDQVDVFGFGSSEKGRWHHYYEDKTYQTGPHAASHEYEIIKKLEEKQKIKLFT